MLFRSTGPPLSRRECISNDDTDRQVDWPLKCNAQRRASASERPRQSRPSSRGHVAARCIRTYLLACFSIRNGSAVGAHGTASHASACAARSTRGATRQSHASGYARTRERPRSPTTPRDTLATGGGGIPGKGVVSYAHTPHPTRPSCPFFFCTQRQSRSRVPRCGASRASCG